MNYVKETRSFREWIYRNSPSMGQIALWYALFDLCNQTGWKEWFNAANNTLMLGSGLSRPGIVKCREFLKEQGLIDFKTYGPNKAADYRMIPFTSQKVDIEVDIPVDIDEPASQKVDIPVANELAFQYRIPKQDLITTTTTTLEHDFNKVSKAYGRIHNKYDIEPKYYPTLTKLLESGIPADFMIEIMQQKHKEKTDAGESVSGFGYYEPVIKERHTVKFKVYSGKKQTDWDSITKQLEEAEARGSKTGA